MSVTVDVSTMYCMTMLMASAVLGLSLITYGLTQQHEKVVVVTQRAYRGRTISAGQIDSTGLLAEINGARIILARPERPYKRVALVAMK